MFATLAHLGPAPGVAPRCAAREKSSLKTLSIRAPLTTTFQFASSFLPLFGFSSQAEQSLDSESKTYCARSKIPESKNRSACFAICSRREKTKLKGWSWGWAGGGGVWELSSRGENEGCNWSGPPRQQQIILEDSEQHENGRLKVQNPEDLNQSFNVEATRRRSQERKRSLVSDTITSLASHKNWSKKEAVCF